MTERHGLREQFSCSPSHCLVACELTYIQQISLCEGLLKDTAVVNLGVSRAEVNKSVVLPILARVLLCVGHCI